MLIKKKKTTNGVRGKIFFKNFNTIKNKPLKSICKKLKFNSGRNNFGVITVKHKGGGVKKKYRFLDFSRINFDQKGKVIRIEYDPNRNSSIALILYENNIKSYIILPKNLFVNDFIISSLNILPNKIGNNMPVGFIPIGIKIHCIEKIPTNFAKFVRSAGCYGLIISKNKDKVNIVLKSGEIKILNFFCRATIGEICDSEFFLMKIGKSGINRLSGLRPTVRGVAMNPVDHPHGGGEGKTSGGRDPVSPWGFPCKGFKTRKNFNIIKYKN